MTCLHGESEVGKKKACFACKKCGAMTEKKGHVCKPKKLKKKDERAGKSRKKKSRDKKEKKDKKGKKKKGRKK